MTCRNGNSGETDNGSLSLFVEWDAEDDSLKPADTDTYHSQREEDPAVPITNKTAEVSQITGLSAEKQYNAISDNSDVKENLMREPEESEQRPDTFEWSEEREREINEILEGTEGLPLPVVHYQLSKIHISLEENSISGTHACILLKEIENYIQDKLDKKTNKDPVSHPAIEASRSLIIDSLFAYKESAHMYLGFLENRDSTNLVIASRLCEQALQFLLQGKDMLLGAKPMDVD